MMLAASIDETGSCVELARVDEFASVDEARSCVEFASVRGRSLAHGCFEVADVGCSAIAVVDAARRAHLSRTDEARGARRVRITTAIRCR